MAQSILDDKHNIEDLRRIFKLFDRDGSGSISAKELVNVWRGMGQNPTEEDLDYMMKMIDKDKSDSLSWEEFLELLGKNLVKPRDTIEDELREAFKLFDRNQDGYVDSLELQWAITHFGTKMTLEEAAEMVKMVDSDDDGRLNYEEFVRGFTPQ